MWIDKCAIEFSPHRGEQADQHNFFSIHTTPRASEVSRTFRGSEGTVRLWSACRLGGWRGKWSTTVSVEMLLYWEGFSSFCLPLNSFFFLLFFSCWMYFCSFFPSVFFFIFFIVRLILLSLRSSVSLCEFIYVGLPFLPSLFLTHMGFELASETRHQVNHARTSQYILRRHTPHPSLPPSLPPCLTPLT